MSEIVVPAVTEITGSIADWIELLQHKKTAATAITCIVYVGNVFGACESSPVRVKITEIECDDSSYARATVGKDGIIRIIGYPDIQVEIVPSNDPKKDRAGWVDAKQCTMYAHHLAALINNFGRPSMETTGWKWWEPDLGGIFSGIIRSLKALKPAWSDHDRTESTTKVLEYLEKFFENRENGAFTEKIGQLLLNAIISFDRGSHFSQYSPLHEATKGAALFNSRIIDTTLYQALKTVAIPTSRPAPLKKKYANRLLRPNRIPGQKTHLLSLDGGGIRGLVLTTILSAIEREIPGFFNKIKWTAGTSTGSILALAMCQGKTIDQCRNMYFKFKDVVFKRSSGVSYDHKILESFLKKVYGKGEQGEELTMLELGKNSKKMIISTSVDKSGENLNVALFKSYKVKEIFAHTYREMIKDDATADSTDTLFNVDDCFERKSTKSSNSEEYVLRTKRETNYCEKTYETDGGPTGKHTVRDPHPGKTHVYFAARSTSAAPTYFDSPDESSYIDGGVMNNNPTLVLLNEWIKYNEAEKSKEEEAPGMGKIMQLGAVISVGTGRAKNASSTCKCQPTTGERCREIRDIVRVACKLKGEASFKDVIARSDGQVVEQSFSNTSSHNGAFFRFTPTFPEDIEMDEMNNLTLIEMMWDTKVYMRRQTKYLKILKEIFDSDPKDSN